MATQQEGTYLTERITFVGSPEQRGGTSAYDQRFVNFFPELLEAPITGAKHHYLRQRGGLVYNQTTAPGMARGIYYYNGSTFSVVADKLYRNGVVLQTLATIEGAIGFQEYAGLDKKFLIVLDGIKGWVINSAHVITEITDPDFPTPHVVHSAYLDGYLFVAKAGTDDIYNCVLEDPLAWSPGDFISAEMFQDEVTALCRQNNYVVAMGQKTIEYFYNTGVFPGTPLARNAAALHQIGTSAPATMSQVEEQIIFVGHTAMGGRTVWLMNGFTPTEISTEPVRRSLDAETLNIVSAKAFCVRTAGHKFYVINLTDITWVYDLDTRMWHQWADHTGLNKFPCDFASDHPLGAPLMQDRVRGLDYVMGAGVSTDSTGPGTVANITSIAISSKVDFGVMNNKFMHRFTLLADLPASGGACTLEWSDDDYRTWSSPRSIPLNDTIPTITQLGRFRRRAFKLTYSQPTPMRLEGFEVDLNIGSQ